MTIFSNKELALRLETIEALNQVEFAITHNRFHADSIAEYKKVGSGYAVYAGPDSPLTQAFGLALDGVMEEQDLSEMEEFYKQRGSAVNIEVCHLSDMSLTELLMDRGYRVIEYSNVLLRRLNAEDVFNLSSDNLIREIREDEIDVFAGTVSEGFLEGSEIPEYFTDIFRVFFRQSNGVCFGAFRNQEPAGGGAVFIRDGVAEFGGASTLPKYRNLGIQTDLLRQRLNYAVSKGCDLAMVTTLPGSVSHRNVEKQGFQVVYARTKFTRTWQE